jgi:hypothetical protein
MKTVKKTVLAAALAFVGVGTINQAQAYYDRYPDGYWDHHGHYRHYEIYHHHRGYWDDRDGGGRIWINIG